MKEGELRREGKKSGREGGRDLLFLVNCEILRQAVCMPYTSFKQSTDYGNWLVTPQANFNFRAFVEVLTAANFSLC